MILRTNIIRVLFALSLLPLVAIADGGYLRSAVPLDEPRGYCLDVAGFGANVRTDDPLRVHTCKYGEDNIDQLFRWVDVESGHIVMPAYDRRYPPSAIATCGLSQMKSATVPSSSV